MDVSAADIAAFVALLVSSVSAVAAWQAMKHAKRQADLAGVAVDQARESGHSASVMHFTSRHFDLVRNGHRFEDTEWATQYWWLLDTEFYFFDNGWLPRFIFELWMVDLVRCYRLLPEALPSHKKHIARYSERDRELPTFFDGLMEIAQSDPVDAGERYFAIRAYVHRYPIYASRTP